MDSDAELRNFYAAEGRREWRAHVAKIGLALLFLFGAVVLLIFAVFRH